MARNRYNGLDLANSLAKDEKNTVAAFVLGDAASCGVAGLTTPNGYYNIERTLRLLDSKGGKSGSAARAWTPAASSPQAWLKARIEARWTN